MAGTDPGFSSSEFRAAIRYAMNMGLPNAAQDEIIFHFDGSRDYLVEDHSGDPYDWSSTPTSEVVATQVAVTCAVEFIPRSTLSAGNGIADFDTPRMIITVLDEEYLLIQGFDYLVHSENRYNVEYVRPKLALFNVDVIQIELVAVDES